MFVKKNDDKNTYIQIVTLLIMLIIFTGVIFQYVVAHNNEIIGISSEKVIENLENIHEQLVAINQKVIRTQGSSATYDYIFNNIENNLKIYNWKIGNFQFQDPEISIIYDEKVKQKVMLIRKDVMNLSADSKYLKNILIYLDKIENNTSEPYKYDMRVEVYKEYFYLWFTVALILLMFLFWIYEKQIKEPLCTIQDNLKKISSNNLLINNESYDESIQLLISHFNEMVIKSDSMKKMSLSLSQHKDIEEMVLEVYNTFKKHIPFDRIDLDIYDSTKNFFIAFKSISSDGKIFEDKYSYSADNDYFTKELIDKNMPKIINDMIEYHEVNNLDIIEEFIDSGILSTFAIPLKNGNRKIGILYFSSYKTNQYLESHLQLMDMNADILSASIDKVIFFEDMLFNSLDGFARIAESRDAYMGDHIHRMNEYSKRISEYLETSKCRPTNQKFTKNIFRASTLHDIGKVAVSDLILLKPGKLTFDEFEKIKKHSMIGYGILEQIKKGSWGMDAPIVDMALNIIKYHHEKYDGSGYPEGLIGEDIPLEARIVAIADVFDALTSERVYKPAFTFDESIQLIIENRAKHFDPYIVDELIGNMVDFKNIYDELTRNEEND